MIAWMCIAAGFPIPSSAGGVPGCHGAGAGSRWQQDYPALAALCVCGGEKVSVLSSREGWDTKTISETLLPPHSWHPGQRARLGPMGAANGADVGAAAERCWQQRTCRAAAACREDVHVCVCAGRLRAGVGACGSCIARCPSSGDWELLPVARAGLEVEFLQQ